MILALMVLYLLVVFVIIVVVNITITFMYRIPSIHTISCIGWLVPLACSLKMTHRRCNSGSYLIYLSHGSDVKCRS
jgi:hypothetical protein